MRNRFRIALVVLATVASFIATPFLPATKAVAPAFKPTLATVSAPSIRPIELKFVEGWTLFSFPATPIEVDPERLFVDAAGDSIDIDGNLYSYDPHAQEAFTYDAANPGRFGAIDQNLSYWLRVDEETTMVYWGVDTYKKRSTWLHKGMNMLAYPYETAQEVKDLKVRNHATFGEEITFAQARELRIVDGVIYAWDAEHQGLYDVGLEEDFASNQILEPGHGYWFQGLKEGYELVITKP